METTVQADRPRLVLDKTYVKSLLGVLKMIQMLCAFLTLVLSASVQWGSQGGGWVNFVAVVSLINSIVWFFFYLFNTVPPVFANFYVELIAYAVLTFFLLIAGCLAASYAHINVLLATTIFAFACLIAYLIDTLLQAMVLREKYKQRNDRRTAVPTQEPANI